VNVVEFTEMPVLEIILLEALENVISNPTGLFAVAARVGPWFSPDTVLLVKVLPFPLLSIHCVIGADPVIVDWSAPSYHMNILPMVLGSHAA
jgi:hypothetical protein